MWGNTTGMSDFSSLGMLMGIYNGGIEWGYNGGTMEGYTNCKVGTWACF